MTDAKGATGEKVLIDAKSTTDVTGKAWERIQKQAQKQRESYKAGNLGANSVESEMGERIDLTIDSGCAACALPVGVASAVSASVASTTRCSF